MRRSATLGIAVTVDDAVRVADKRAAAEPVVLKPAAPDDVVEVTLEGGVRLICRRSRCRNSWRHRPVVRWRLWPGTIPLAPTLPIGDGSRGIGEWAI